MRSSYLVTSLVALAAAVVLSIQAWVQHLGWPAALGIAAAFLSGLYMAWWTFGRAAGAR